MPVSKFPDPTRTTMLRAQYMADMARRFAVIRRIVYHAIYTQDVLGLRPAVNPFISVNQLPEKQAWRFQTDSQKVESFNKWFKEQVDEQILQVDVKGNPWTAKYVDSAYRKGSVRAYVDTHKEDLAESPDFYKGSKSQFLQTAFAHPERVSKLKFLGTRSYDELKGISSELSKQMSRVLADGIAHGLGAEAVARNMTNTINGIERTRARTLARTELIAAHAEGQLDSFEDLGVKELGVLVEWATAGDDRVCPQCAEMNEAVMTVDEARGMIPFHPNCRCAWIPSRESILQDKKQVWTKAEKQKHVDDALLKGLPKKTRTGEKVPQTIAEARRRSTWLGKTKKFKTSTVDAIEDVTPKVVSKPVPKVTPKPKPTPKSKLKPAPAPKPVPKPKPKAVSKTEKLKKELEESKLKTEILKKQMEEAQAKVAATEKELEAARKDLEKVGITPSKLTMDTVDDFAKKHNIQKISMGEIKDENVRDNILEAVQNIVSDCIDRQGVKEVFENNRIINSINFKNVEYIKNEVSDKNGALWTIKTKQIDVAIKKAHFNSTNLKHGLLVDDPYSLSARIRHEIGHAVHENLMDFKKGKKVYDEWMVATGSSKLRSPYAYTKFSTTVSRYGSTDGYELFAESFSAYTHPNYQRGFLPKRIEDFMDKYIGKKVTT